MQDQNGKCIKKETDNIIMCTKCVMYFCFRFLLGTLDE